MVLMQPHDLGKKKIVLITGCDSGHGLNVAEHLAFFHRDTHVIATVKDPFSEGATKLYKLQQLNIRVYQLDVTSELDISMMEDRVKRTIEEENGVLWALINNAATFGYANLEGTTPEHMKEEFRRRIENPLFSKEFFGAFNMALTFWKHLCDNGRLVNMVNFCKDCPTTLHEHYVGSKMPLIQFSAILRDMLKQHNIQTTLLNPGDKSYKEMVKIMSPQEYQSQYGDRRGLYRMRLELNRRHFGQPTVMPPFQAENLVENVDKILTSDPVSDVYTPTFSEFLTYADYLRRAPKYVNLPMLRKLMTKFI